MTEDNLNAQVHNLGGLVEYQPGSVVSRTLLNKSSGTVTIFAFDRGESLSEHTTPYDALVFAVDGDLEIALAGERHQVRSGDVLLMPANVPHAVDARTQSKMVLVMIRE